MTKEQHLKWVKNGNIKLSYEKYQQLANDLAENVFIPQSKRIELAKCLQLSLVESNNENQMLKLDVLDFALKMQKTTNHPPKET